MLKIDSDWSILLSDANADDSDWAMSSDNADNLVNSDMRFENCVKIKNELNF